MKKILISITILLLLTSCTRKEEVQIPLTDKEYEAIELEKIANEEKVEQDSLAEELARELVESEAYNKEIESKQLAEQEAYNKKIEAEEKAKYQEGVQKQQDIDIAISRAYIISERAKYAEESLTADAERLIVIDRKLQVLQNLEDSINALQ